MKRFLIGLATVIILSPLSGNSAVMGDINQDGKIDLMESIYALQVASGLYPSIDDSCLLTGKGAWVENIYYNLCDVITFSELTYACINAHTSLGRANGPPNTTYWTVLSIKGEPGGGQIGEVSSAGQVWMDRNLGALRVATKSTDPDAYGSLYQWGRPGDGHEYRTSPITTTRSDSPNHGSFITVSASPYDWRITSNDTLWADESSPNNPCPAAFRLPTEAEWAAEQASWASNDAAGAFGSPLKLVLAGYRHNANGAVSYVGTEGVYWSSTDSSTNSSYLYFSTTAYTYSTKRAMGYSVRCIKDYVPFIFFIAERWV